MIKVDGDCTGVLAIYVDRFTVAFASIRESSWECITWYPWCLEIEPSYGKANPHTGRLTLLQRKR